MIAGCASNLGFDADTHRPVVVETFRLQAGTLPRKKEFSASTLPWEMVVLSFKTSGRLIEAPFEEGDAVKKGQIVGRLDPVDQYMAHAVAREKLRSLEADVARVEKLARQGALPDAERERILGYRDALATQMAQAGIQMDATVLRAPMDGIVGRKMANSGEMMDPARPLGVLLVLDPIKVQVAVQEADLPLFSPGASLRVRIGSNSLEGKVHQISTVADEATRTFTVTLSVPNRRMPPRPSVWANWPGRIEFAASFGFFRTPEALETGTAGHARCWGWWTANWQYSMCKSTNRKGSLSAFREFSIAAGRDSERFFPARRPGGAIQGRMEYGNLAPTTGTLTALARLGNEAKA